jgi:hypothetical protein
MSIITIIKLSTKKSREGGFHYQQCNVQVNGNAKRCPAQAVFHLLVIFIGGGFDVVKLQKRCSA